MSGWELIALARGHRQLMDVPIILCSADVWELKKRTTDLEHVAGAHVLTKPFELGDMTRLIQQLLAERPAGAPPATAEG